MPIIKVLKGTKPTESKPETPDTMTTPFEINKNDGNNSVAVGHLTVTLDFEGEISFVVTDSQHADKHDGSVGIELTGFGAFRTMRLIRPAVEALIALADERGINWWVQPTCPRRHKLYSRYIDESRIIKGY